MATMTVDPVALPALALRVAGGLVEPGGDPVARRMVAALDLAPGDRVVELAAGIGTTSARLVAAGIGGLTAVEPDPLATERLRDRVAGPGRTARERPVTETGLPDGSAAAVVVGSGLSVLDRGGKLAVLREAGRLLRTGGRLGLHELVLVPPHEGEDAERAVAEAVAADGGPLLRPLTAEGWRALAEEAGLVAIGASLGPLRPRPTRELMREAGVRTALALVRELALDQDLRREGERLRGALELNARHLRAVALLAERPLIFGHLRPRR